MFLIITAVLFFCVEICLELTNVGQEWQLLWTNLKEFGFKGALIVFAGLIFTSCFLALVPFKDLSYKTKLTYIAPIVFIHCTSYHFVKMADYNYGLSEDYNYFQARRDISEGNVQLLGVGLLVEESKNVKKAQDSLCKVFGFRSVPIGCISTEGIEIYNETVIDFLTKKNGKGWQQSFYHKMDSIRKVN